MQAEGNEELFALLYADPEVIRPAAVDVGGCLDACEAKFRDDEYNGPSLARRFELTWTGSKVSLTMSVGSRAYQPCLTGCLSRPGSTFMCSWRDRSRIDIIGATSKVRLVRHEAAHAVVRRIYGMPTHSMSVVPNHYSAGSVIPTAPKGWSNRRKPSLRVARPSTAKCIGTAPTCAKCCGTCSSFTAHAVNGDSAAHSRVEARSRALAWGSLLGFLGHDPRARSWVKFPKAQRGSDRRAPHAGRRCIENSVNMKTYLRAMKAALAQDEHGPPRFDS